MTAVVQEVKPFLGQFGRVILLEQSKQLLVIEMAGKMPTINLLIPSVPEPPLPAPPAAPPSPSEPVFAAYAIGPLDPQNTLKTIRALVNSERIVVDETTHVLSAYLVPSQQVAIKAALDKMLAVPALVDVPHSIAYPLGGLTADNLVKQIAAISPRATVIPDAITGRILVTALAADHEKIARVLQALGIGAGQPEREVRAFQVGSGQASLLATTLRTMLPNSQFLPNDANGTIVVRGDAADVKLASEVLRTWLGEGGGMHSRWSPSRSIDRPTTLG